MPRDRYMRQSLPSLSAKIKTSRILMVGAGGIGCELLKNLVLTGFGEIHIVDLDTIDLSNLNRQFLFRQEHIKKPKALVAKESAAKFNPHIKLEAHHANIKDLNFNIDWFQSFNIVFNALDNLDARRHVNRMCLAADVPLIESGTTGFNGQVQVIIKGKTECYDCTTKEVPKSFPVCTIRSTPSQPIHCIVWAKSYLFVEMFGVRETESPELDHTEDSENAKEIKNLQQEAQALQSIRDSIGSKDFARKVFAKVFTDDINRLRRMDDMWKSRKPPNALLFETLSTNAVALSIDPQISRQDQRIWSEAENFTVFCDSLRRLSDRFQQQQQAMAGDANHAPTMIFDKDDEDILDFVAASANLRSIIFGIELKSKFDTKQMAGNIIPAIATTNAMTAGLCVLQAFKVLRNDIGKAKMVFLERSGARVINSDTLKPPNVNCSVCAVMQSRLLIDPARAILNDLVEGVLKLQLKYGAEFSVNNEVGTLYDPDFGDNLSKKFCELGVKADTFLTVIDDDEEHPRINLSLSISEQCLPPDSEPVKLLHHLEIARKPIAEPEGLANGHTNGHSLPENSATKRKRSLEADTEHTPKRGKIQVKPLAKDLLLNDSVMIDGGKDDDAIVIDDD